MTSPGPKNFRRSFTAAFKRAAIVHAEESNNCAAGRKFGVSERVVRQWRKQRDEIFACDAKRRGFRGPKSGRFPELEAKLAAYVTELRDRSLLVTCEMVTEKARLFALEAGIPRSRFKASRSWASKFMKRAGFSLRRRTSVCQKLPSAYEEKVLAFHRYFLKLRDSRQYLLGQIGNADQTPVYFDMASNTTMSAKGAREVNLLTTGNEKLRFTVMLSCLADGTKLRPYVVFKRKTIPKEVFPGGVVVRANEKGYMTEDMVVEWYRLVWLMRPGASLRKGIPNLLVLDSFRGHLTEKVKAELRKEETDMLVIPGGLTGQLQPLDVGVNKPFKDLLRREYNEWLSADNRELTPAGRVKRASLATVCGWVLSAWSAIPRDVVMRSFAKCGLTLDDDVLWDRSSCDGSSSTSDDEDTSEDEL